MYMMMCKHVQLIGGVFRRGCMPPGKDSFSAIISVLYRALV